ASKIKTVVYQRLQEVNPPSHTARPRPPWFLATKTTISTITEDHAGPAHHDTPFPRDPPQGMFPEMHQMKGVSNEGGVNYEEGLKSDGDDDSSSSTTTTTLRPPPWLITNSTKNVTVTPTTTSTTTTTTTSTTTTASTTIHASPKPSKEISSPGVVKVTSSTLAPDHLPGVIDKGIEDTKEREDSEGHEDPKRIHYGLRKQKYPTERVLVTILHGVRHLRGRGLFWNWTRSGEVAVQSCPGGASGWATRPCAPRGWVSPPDLGDCRSVWLSSLLTRTKSEAESKDGALAVAEDLTKVTRDRKLYGGDITATARLVSELTRRMGEDLSSFPDGAQREALVTELVEETLKTVSNLVVWQRPAWGDLGPSEHNSAESKKPLSSSLIIFIMKKRFLLPHPIYVLETRNVGRVTFPTQEDPWPSQESPSPFYQSSLYSEDGDGFTLSSSEVPSPTSDTQTHQDFITLPPEALLENSENGLVKMVFFSYKGLENLLQPQKNYRYIEGGIRSLNRTRVLNSRVISASLGAGRHIELSEPVFITFTMIRTENVSNAACVFWDFTTNSWSEEGCSVILYNITHATCRCDHLTNFAVLMDVHASPISPQHQVALSVITYVGCVISIVGLLLATIVFHAFKGLKSDRTTIHKNLCICLLVGEAIFIGGITRTDQPIVCSVVAGLLHYFFLAAFAWMLLEGFQLYITLIEVFEAEKSRVRWYYVTAYGFPAVVVAVSAFIDPNSYGTDTVCWLRTDNYFIFAFVGPVLLVLVANSIFLALSLVLMCRHAQNSAVLKNKETSKLESLRSWIRGAVILMFLLGLTWTFGLLYLDQATVAMAYVFTVLNSLQGLFIFVFHCLQNDKVKTETNRLCRRYTWLRACLCYSRSHSTPTASTKTDAHNSQLAHSQASNSVGTFCTTVHQHNDASCLCVDLERISLNHNTQVSSSSSSSECPSSSHSLATEGLSKSHINLPVLHHPEPHRDYQNALPLHIQQLHAAQIYATPPSTPPLSELYDIANPHIHLSPHKHFLHCKKGSHQVPQIPNHQENIYVETRYCAQAINVCPHAQPHSNELISLNPPFVQIARNQVTPNVELKSAVALHKFPTIIEQRDRPTISLEEDESNYLRPKYHYPSSSSTHTCPHASHHPPLSLPSPLCTVPEPLSVTSKPTLLHHPSRSSDFSQTTPTPNETWQGENQGIKSSFVETFLICFILMSLHFTTRETCMRKYSFKSCGRDSGHGGSEQEESPRTGPPAKISSLRLNNNVNAHHNNDRPHIVNPFAAAAALEHSSNPAAILPDYRMAGDVSSLRYQCASLPGVRVAHRNQSPWNHTYTEIPDGVVVRPLEASGPDPVYEEIEREARSEIQVSDMSDEDGRRQSSDISRQSSRSYGDHRPLLPYTLPDRNCPASLQTADPRFQQRLRHSDQMNLGDNQLQSGNRLQPQLDHTIVSAGHILPLSHASANGNHPLPPGNGHIGSPIVDVQQYQEAVLSALGHNTVVQPLSEPNLRSWEAVQRHRDLQQLQHLGEMTVAVLNGEQVVCKLKSPLAPIHENSSSQATTVATATVGAATSGNSERYLPPQTYSHC
ncbi:Adhesion G protein-coupled receptor L3, partial [Armadillidium nasatum]